MASYSNLGHGMDLWTCENTSITNSVFHGNRLTGIYLYDVSTTVVSGCESHDNYRQGVAIDQSRECKVSDSTLWGNDDGVVTSRSEDCLVIGNEIFENVGSGVVAHVSTGIDILDNYIRDNKDTGIKVLQSTNCTIYGNVVCYNSAGNAWDDGTSNLWYDGVSEGNTWSDYNGTGPYPIGGEAGSFDRFPSATDLDGDGLSDWSETNIHGTDPHRADTDGDGVSDGIEVAVGLDPLDPLDGVQYVYRYDAIWIRLMLTVIILLVYSGAAFRRRGS